MCNSVYYNEIDEYAAQWLRNLISEGYIPSGDVDTRPIEEVSPDDIKGYKQCHFFAGIGGWAYALRLAGWPDDKPVWTGSCPCQPFSAAGRGRGFNDERHLWPTWYKLIQELRPNTIFGEQVASKDGLAWLDVVQTDLEASGYAVGAVDICAASVGAPHIRQRLWLVADSVRQRRERCFQPYQPRQARPGWPSSAEDLQQIADNPFSPWNGAPQPVLSSLDDGVSARVVALRSKCAGNAIVPQVAAEVIAAYMSLTRTKES